LEWSGKARLQLGAGAFAGPPLPAILKNGSREINSAPSCDGEEQGAMGRSFEYRLSTKEKIGHARTKENRLNIVFRMFVRWS
jgi:hypothetical protein